MWSVEWGALSGRIRSLVEAATFLGGVLGGGERDEFGVHQEIFRNAEAIRAQIKRFRENHGPELPEPAQACLTAFLGQQFPDRMYGLPAMYGAVTLLASFLSEFSYLLNDTDAVARSRVARAFTHLKRSIVADPEIRKRWKTAFTDGETACERLGACHLLLHGVWAFKASAEGGRTDLILGESLCDSDEVRAAADVLVLTEWKLVRDPVQTEAKAKEAFAQAQLYSSGVLAGFELRSWRYLILVSGEQLPTVPTRREETGVTYEYINVPVSPIVPSGLSRRLK